MTAVLVVAQRTIMPRSTTTARDDERRPNPHARGVPSPAASETPGQVCVGGVFVFGAAGAVCRHHAKRLTL